MKKNYIFSLFAFFLISITSFSQVNVGFGTTVNEEMPIEPYYKFSYSQVIYLSGEINTSGTITGIKYTATPETTLENSNGWEIWLGHTTLSEFSEPSWVDISELTQVFVGDVTITDQIVEITFDTPFDYNGTDNLMVAVNETSNVNNIWDDNTHDFYCTATTGVYRGLINYSDTGTGDFSNPAPIDPSNPPTVSTSNLRESYANITFEGITQSCPTPDGSFSAENLTGSSATINWTVDSVDGPFQYAYSESGADADNWADISENSVILTDLNPVSDYVFYLRKTCDSEVSMYRTFSFTTDCADLFDLPFTEGFESDSPTENCWTIEDLSPEAAPNNLSWTPIAGNPFEGSRSAYLWTTGNQGKNDDYLISPRLNLSGNDRLKFAVASFPNTTELNSMAVLMSTATSSPDDFTITLSETTEYPNDWTEVSIDLSAYSGPAYIAFHVPPTDSEGYAIYVDAIVVEETPDCDIPINISVSNESLNSADVVWSAGANQETAWEYVVQLAELDPPTGQGTYTESTELFLDDLQPTTDYTFYVRAVCSDVVYSEYTSIGGNFSTVSIGDTCTVPIEIDALPYNTSDDTANYSDYYDGAPGESCGVTNNYLNGNDVVYSYTATSDTSINISMSPSTTYSGVFVYDSCENIGVECLAGVGSNDTSERTFDLDVVTGETYFVVISTWASPQSTGYDLLITENSCTTPTIVTSNVDCTDDSYSVEFELSDMGSAELLTFTDDLGNVQYAEEPGILTFGPYESTSTAMVTVVGEDPNCDQTFVLNSICNDECTGAIPVSVGQTVNGDTTNATNSGNNASNDLWYSFTGNGVEEDITVSLCGSSYDTYLRIFDSCTGEQLYFNDDSCSLQSEITFTSDGTTTYFIMVEGYSSQNGAFTMNISGTLGVDDNEIENMIIYPNPANDGFVNIVSSEMGDKFVELFDINGRKVLSTSISGDRLDISNLEAGFYMTRVTINGKSSTSKLIIN